tara:strand:- start:139 stop:363 length:225 start_codon:yes stop_codon:yes gene_type:complete
MIIPCIKRKEELIKKILKGKKIKKVSLWDFDTDREAYEIKLVLDDNTIVVFLSNRSGIDTMDIKVVKYENNKAD